MFPARQEQVLTVAVDLRSQDWNLRRVSPGVHHPRTPIHKLFCEIPSWAEILRKQVSEPLERRTMENITGMVTDKKSYNCQEGSKLSATDNYILFKDNIVSCQEGTRMQRISKTTGLKNILAILIITVILFSLIPVITTAQQDDVSVRFQTKYIEFDQNLNSYRLLVNISTNKPGHVIYLEEYYTVDGKSNPKFVSSGRFDGGELVKTNSSYFASFEILRPVPHGGKTYTLAKSVILLDNQRVLEYWLTRNKDFIDNTGTSDEDDTLVTELQNIDRYETREKILVKGSPVTFEYSSLDVIYEINVTGNANGEVELRVELLKGRPSNTDKAGGIAYRYIDMSADSNKLGEIALKYRVENSWMKNRSIPDINVGMFSWNGTGKKWELLLTRIIDKDGRYTYYESVAPGLASFAIAGNPSKANSTANKTTVKGNGSVNSSAINGTREPLIRDIPGFGFISAVASLILIFRHLRKEVSITPT